jgi:hypothetical protein
MDHRELGTPGHVALEARMRVPVHAAVSGVSRWRSQQRSLKRGIHYREGRVRGKLTRVSGHRTQQGPGAQKRPRSCENSQEGAAIAADNLPVMSKNSQRLAKARLRINPGFLDSAQQGWEHSRSPLSASAGVHKGDGSPRQMNAPQ